MPAVEDCLLTKGGKTFPIGGNWTTFHPEKLTKILYTYVIEDGIDWMSQDKSL